jgi:PucR C-terminal helix-turn-helix domain
MRATSDSTTLAAIVRRIDRADLAERMVERFRGEIAGYRRLPEPTVLGEILDVSRQNIDLFFRTIVEGHSLGEADYTPFRESAKRRATEGMPLEDLLHAYRLGGRLAWQMVVEAAEPDEQDLLLSAAGLVMEYIDAVSSSVAQSYMEERTHLVSEEERSLRALLEAIAGTAAIEGPLRNLAERIGFPLLDQYVPFCQTAQGGTAHEHSRFAQRLRSEGLLALTEGDRVLGLAPPDAAIPRAKHPRALMALGEPTPRRRLTDALDDVRLLLDIGLRFDRAGEITLDSHMPELLLARSPRLAARLEVRVLGRLQAAGGPRSPDLLETLEVFLASGLDRREAASRLHVHPNTLNYRLRRVEEVTGLQLSSPDDLMLVALAVRQRAIA